MITIKNRNHAIVLALLIAILGVSACGCEPNDGSSANDLVITEDVTTESETMVTTTEQAPVLPETTEVIAVETEELAIPIETEPEETTETEPNLIDNIRPEFKEAMDSYEAFFDEYCEFMKKYMESDDLLSMMTDYASYMAQYSETMDKLEKMGEEEMSDAESAYYLEVMTRINTKLMEVAIA